jgi:hypothetical protein
MEVDMTIARKTILAVGVAAGLLSACATGPYYDNGYGYGYQQGYGHPGYETAAPYYGPAYGYDTYAPGYYAGPTFGLGLSFSDGGRDRWEGRRDRGDRREWRGRDDWHGDDGHDRHGENGDRH